MATTPKENPYVGEPMVQCLLQPFDFNSTYAVAVSGASWNPCGHTLLNAGGTGGWYFHIAECMGYPRFMREEGFRRYLNDTQKRELRRSFIAIPKPEGAHRKLAELLSNQWNWFISSNNCASFVGDVLAAGGGDAGLYSSCSTLEQFP